jgi:hypothetical protein
LLERGVKWIAQSEQLCHKFGVGLDSLAGRVILLESLLVAGLSIVDLNRMSDGLYKNYPDLDALAQATLKEALRIGNQLEQAPTFMMLAHLALQKGDVCGFQKNRQQALEIYKHLKRPDLLQQSKQWDGG